ncbi:MAG: alpha/beta hydrolase [Janthinobacterium lividum]
MPKQPGSSVQALRIGPLSGGAPSHLVVLLHGLTATAGQFGSVMDGLRDALPHAAFHLPNGSEPFEGGPGRQWFSMTSTLVARREGLLRAGTNLNTVIDKELDRLGLAGGCCALVGFNQGGIMAMHAGLRRDVAPALLASYAGEFLLPDLLPDEIRNRAPALLVHSRDDGHVPLGRSRDARRVLRGCAVPVTTFYPRKGGHALSEAGMTVVGAELVSVFSGARASLLSRWFRNARVSLGH